MSDAGNARDSSPVSSSSGDPSTPPNPTDPGPFSTPVSHATAEGPLNGYATTGDSRSDLKKEVKIFTITNPDPKWVQRIFLYNHIINKRATAILKDLKNLGLYDAKKKRWVILPKQPTKEDELYDPYTMLIEAIIDSLKTNVGLNGSRKVKISAGKGQTHQESHRPAEQDQEISSRPDVLIVGYDSAFLPNPLETPLPSEFERAISVGDIKREKNHEGEEDILSQVAMYARQCFIQQCNRRFIFGFVLTEERIRLLLFDRSGAVVSEWIDIHADATLFIKYIWLLAGVDLVKMGFDPSIFWDESIGERLIEIPVSVDRRNTNKRFTIIRVLYLSRSIRGPGIVCWLVCDLATGREFIVRDMWVHPDRAYEQVFLEEAATHQVEAVVPIMWAQKKDDTVTTSALRRFTKNLEYVHDDGSQFINLSFRRVVTEKYSLITEFDSHLHFLEAMYDIIKGHRDLVTKAKVLHRNINLNTIVLGDPKVKGKRGMLADLSMAIVEDRGPDETLVEKDLRFVTNVFLPLHALWAAIPTNAHLALKRSHKFSNDMEAFYYAFVWVLMEYNGPKGHRVLPSARSPVLQALEDPNAQRCHNAKIALLTNASKLGESFPILTPYFDHRPIKLLLQGFSEIIKQFCADKGPGVVHSKEEKEEFYKSILKLFKKAIKSITDIPLPVENGLQVPSNEHRTTDVEEGPVPGQVYLPTETVTDRTEAAESASRGEDPSEPENPFLDKKQDEEVVSAKQVKPTNTLAGDSEGSKAHASKGKETQITKPQHKKAATARIRSPRKRGNLNLNKRIEEEPAVRNRMEREEQRVGQKRKQQPVVYTAGIRSSKRVKAKEANVDPEA